MAKAENTTPSNSKKPPAPIGIFTIFFLVFTAVLFDGIQAVAGIFLGVTGFLLPLAAGLNVTISIIALTIFCMWFLLLGRLSPLNSHSAIGRGFVWGGGGVTEVLPLLNGFVFGITGIVVSLILISIAEDAVAKGKTLPFGLHRLAGGPRRGTIKNRTEPTPQAVQERRGFLQKYMAKTKMERREEERARAKSSEPSRGGGLPRESQARNAAEQVRSDMAAAFEQQERTGERGGDVPFANPRQDGGAPVLGKAQLDTEGVPLTIDGRPQNLAERNRLFREHERARVWRGRYTPNTQDTEEAA